MRIGGYILLLVGLFLILAEATVGRSERRAIWIGRSYHAMQEARLPIDSPIAKVFGDMNRSWHDTVAFMAIPAILMAVGGVFLDQTRRNGKRKSPNQASEATSEPAPGAASSSPQG
jgi:hypothetical protein